MSEAKSRSRLWFLWHSWLATGARQRDIRRQFLIEAVMVSLVGGVAGLVIGLTIGGVLIFGGCR